MPVRGFTEDVWQRAVLSAAETGGPFPEQVKGRTDSPEVILCSLCIHTHTHTHFQKEFILLVLNSRSSCLSLLGVGIIGTCYQACLEFDGSFECLNINEILNVYS